MNPELKLKMIEVEPHYWRVVYPEVVLKNESLFKQAKEFHTADPTRAEKGYRQVMANCGELYIDATSHLGMLLNNRKEGFGTMYIVQAYTQARLIFPDDFVEGRDLLVYESVGNGFILTAYYVMAMELTKVNKDQEALDIFGFLLKINPKDNHGAKRWTGVLRERIARK